MTDMVPMGSFPPLPSMTGGGVSASLTRRAKAAIVVRLLLNEGADIPLEDLPDALQEALTHQMGEMRMVDRETLFAVAAEFAQEVESVGLSFPPGIAGALDALDGKISRRTAVRLRKEAGVRQWGDPWARLKELDPDKLLAILETESVEVAAVMLSKLPVATSAALLGRLPGPQARRITYADQWDTQGFYAAVIEHLNVDLPIIAWCEEEGVDDDVIRERLIEATDKAMAAKAEAFGPQNMRTIEKQLLLQSIDGKWRDHLMTLEHLRSVVGFRGYAQRDPLNEYKNESFQLFESMLDSLRQDVTQKLGQAQPMSAEERNAFMQEIAARQAEMQKDAAQAEEEPRVAVPSATAVADGFVEDDPTTWGNPSRNDPCPCGSGKKFKHCHGRLV